jgi:hypothetical protein
MYSSEKGGILLTGSVPNATKNKRGAEKVPRIHAFMKIFQIISAGGKKHTVKRLCP